MMYFRDTKTIKKPILRELLLLIVILLFPFVINAQSCLNSSARLNRLKSEGLTKDSLNKWAKNDLDFIQLKSHDTIADIGTYDGYYPSLYSVSSDSVVFYLNDTGNDGFIYFDSIRILCAKIKGTPISSQFVITLGDKTGTNLPAHIFNKVILRDALHHFKFQEEMLADIKRIMKPEAKLILFEPIKDPNVPNGNLCAGSKTKDDFLNLMTENGFELTRELALKDDRWWFEFIVTEN